MFAVDPISKLDCETCAENVRLEYEWARNSYGRERSFRTCSLCPSVCQASERCTRVLRGFPTHLPATLAAHNGHDAYWLGTNCELAPAEPEAGVIRVPSGASSWKSMTYGAGLNTIRSIPKSASHIQKECGVQNLCPTLPPDRQRSEHLSRRQGSEKILRQPHRLVRRKSSGYQKIATPLAKRCECGNTYIRRDSEPHRVSVAVMLPEHPRAKADGSTCRRSEQPLR